MKPADVFGNERILFQNSACLVINKLPGESSEFSRADGKEKLFPAHRLDVPVSGCLLLARTSGAAAFLGAAFSGGDGISRPEKRYWAIVEKPADISAFPPEAELVNWLYEDRKTNKSFVLPFTETPPSLKGRAGGVKKALLRYRTAGEGERYFFLEIDLVTGRHHQIRAQFAAAGLHVKGDLKYGARRSEKGGGIRLHAFSLAFPNPLNPAETIRAEAPPPVMDSLWTACAEAVSGGGCIEPSDQRSAVRACPAV